ncbi:YifB family Mg chelatase-like AAA ATPase [Anaerobacillus isosaccharinicus]|uniref:Magnesium chelatase n=1 Tax=Anaerobacillus isosaccharinicus TaxID=1532552 RepID=A0A1S2L9Q7_9BACI|nr:YifB family Mg chelatase-like AAA ATPase [Anaerobacillus isosaccharinicus]QOY38492.1 YifB family Mg chelatase-like AAA ATPase [Anaerobacillus isosaccharinicus]
MASIVHSFTINGVDGQLINVEADTICGNPSVSIVGLGDTSVKEAKERIEAALSFCGFQFPDHRLIMNLAPSHIKKSGTHFDLPMAIALLARTNQIKINQQSVGLIGELSLNGEIRPVTGVLPMAIAAKENQITHLIVPHSNATEAALVKGLQVIGCETLHQVILFLQKGIIPKPTAVFYEKIGRQPQLDFSDVKGQQMLIEYLTIASAGGHNFLMIGPPGCGKSMIAKRIPSILTPMTETEALEVTKIYSVANLLQEGRLIQKRPFRAPHHNASTNSLIGGGTRSMPGEISLAHNGILFLDEIAEFSKKTLDALRQPMEDRKVTISRVHTTNTYPSNFMLVAAMNPCPCGYFGQEKCRCTDYEILKYRNKLSGPILDRIDIQKHVSYVNLFDDSQAVTSSEVILERVTAARFMQQKRYMDTTINCNAELTPALIKKHCLLDSETEDLLKKAYEHYQYSGRTIHKFLKIARTFADLDGFPMIRKKDIQAALHSRDLDREKISLGTL